MTWAVCYHLSDQRDGPYESYTLVNDPRTELAIPPECDRVELVRTGVNTVAEAVFNAVRARYERPT